MTRTPVPSARSSLRPRPRAGIGRRSRAAREPSGGPRSREQGIPRPRLTARLPVGSSLPAPPHRRSGKPAATPLPTSHPSARRWDLESRAPAVVVSGPPEGLSRPPKRARNRPASRCTAATLKQASGAGARARGRNRDAHGKPPGRRSSAGQRHVEPSRARRDRPRHGYPRHAAVGPKASGNPAGRTRRRWVTAPPEGGDATVVGRAAHRRGDGPAGAARAEARTAPWSDPLRPDLTVRPDGTLSCAFAPLQRMRSRRATWWQGYLPASLRPQVFTTSRRLAPSESLPGLFHPGSAPGVSALQRLSPAGRRRLSAERAPPDVLRDAEPPSGV